MSEPSASAVEMEAARQRLADLAWLAHREACAADRRDDKWTAVADVMRVEIDAAVARERERCAQVAGYHAPRSLLASEIARKIRQAPRP